MKADEVPPYPSATYVLSRWKTLYVSVPKAACTSMKWMVAELQDEDPEVFYRSLSREVARSMTIHRRSIWQNTPTVKEIDEAELEAITPENGWFVFAVIRHPVTRLWSAWQSKLLLQEPLWVERFGDEPWFPAAIETGDDVVDAFHRFVASIRAEPKQPVMNDRHFMNQTRLLRPTLVPYTTIYRTNELPAMLTDLTAHVRGLGYAGPDLALRSSNETPLPLIERVVTPEVVEAVHELYVRDFDSFDFAPLTFAPYDSYPDSLVAEVHRLVDRAQRIGDLALAGQSARRETKEAQPDRRTRPWEGLTRRKG